MENRKRKIKDFFNKTEGNSNKKPSSFGGGRNRPSEHPSGSEHPGSISISDPKVKEGSSYSRRGSYTSSSNAKSTGAKSAYNSNDVNSVSTSSSNAKGTDAKSSYNSNDVNLVNNLSKQSHKNSITKNSANRCQYSSNSAIPSTRNINIANLENKNKEAEILILITFSKIKRSRISRSSQTTLTSKNNFKRVKTNIYLPE